MAELSNVHAEAVEKQTSVSMLFQTICYAFGAGLQLMAAVYYIRKQDWLAAPLDLFMALLFLVVSISRGRRLLRRAENRE
jgi:hypothetical protein